VETSLPTPICQRVSDKWVFANFFGAWAPSRQVAGPPSTRQKPCSEAPSLRLEGSPLNPTAPLADVPGLKRKISRKPQKLMVKNMIPLDSPFLYNPIRLMNQETQLLDPSITVIVIVIIPTTTSSSSTTIIIINNNKITIIIITIIIINNNMIITVIAIAIAIINYTISVKHQASTKIPGGILHHPNFGEKLPWNSYTIFGSANAVPMVPLNRQN